MLKINNLHAFYGKSHVLHHVVVRAHIGGDLSAQSERGVESSVLQEAVQEEVIGCRRISVLGVSRHEDLAIR